jgi:hypothetical protein
MSIEIAILAILKKNNLPEFVHTIPPLPNLLILQLSR